MKQTIQKNTVFKAGMILAFLAAAFFIFTTPQAAHAAFPGQNGKLIWDGLIPGDEGEDAEFSLMESNLDGSGRRTLTSTLFPYQEPIPATTPSYSATGQKIAFSMIDPVNSTNNIFISNADGSNRQQLTFFDQEDGKSAYYPRFNPDGTKIIYSEFTVLEESTLIQTFTVNADGSNRQQLNLLGSDNCDSMPVYSPDGTKIAFFRHLSGEDERYLGVYIANSDGTNPQKVADSVSFTPCAPDFFGLARGIDWSPEGNKLVFSGGEYEEGGDIIRLHIKTLTLSGANVVATIRTSEGQNDFLAGSVYISSPQYTPDGHVVFREMSAHEESPRFRAFLGLMNDDGTGLSYIPGVGSESDDNTMLFSLNHPAVQPVPVAPQPSTNQATFTNAENGAAVLLQTPEDTTLTCSTALKESAQTTQDAAYNYPLGLAEFCFTTEAAANQVALTFVTNLTPDQVKARKYNPTTQTYFDIESVTITQTTYQNQPALQLTYTIEDNGELDLDPATGQIKDPVGLGVREGGGGLAGTGVDIMLPRILAAIGVLGFGAYLLRRQLQKTAI